MSQIWSRCQIYLHNFGYNMMWYSSLNDGTITMPAVLRYSAESGKLQQSSLCKIWSFHYKIFTEHWPSLQDFHIATFWQGLLVCNYNILLWWSLSNSFYFQFFHILSSITPLPILWSFFHFLPFFYFTQTIYKCFFQYQNILKFIDIPT